MTMTTSTRLEMGIMAGVLASVVMGLAVITVTALGFLSIQWFSWLGSVFGATGTGGQLAEMGVAWFIFLGLVAGLIFAFAFKQYNVYEGLAFGGIAWFLLVLYLLFETAPQLSGTLQTMSVVASVDLLLPLAVCFALWGAAMGYVGKRYLG